MTCPTCIDYLDDLAEEISALQESAYPLTYDELAELIHDRLDDLDDCSTCNEPVTINIDVTVTIL
jgi:hypothetical protein